MKRTCAGRTIIRSASALLLALSLGLPLAAVPAWGAGPWYVATNGASPWNGLSWAAAFTNAQQAIDSASEGDTIYIAGHTFSNATAVQLNSQLVWTNKGLTILGGYAAEPGGTPGALAGTPTILSQPGGGTNRILYIGGVTNGRLERVTIAGGYTKDPQYGGGVHVTGSSNIVFAACVVSNNYHYMGSGSQCGGGLYVAASVAVMTNCAVIFNHIGTGGYQAQGGGLHLASGSLTVRDSIVAWNSLFRTGGGPTYRGSGVYVAGGSLTLHNVLVHGNAAPDTGTGGAAIYVNNGTLNVANCTIASHPTIALHRQGGTVAATNSIFWGNLDDISGTVTLSYCNTRDGDQKGVNGNISVDPLFEHGYYLAEGSPCVNAGSMTAAAAGLDGRTTRVDGTPDSGTVDLGYHYATGFDLTYADIYVAPAPLGDDVVNNGTNAASPFKTITKGLSVATDGARIHLASGSYTNGSETFPLTIANKVGVQLLGTNRAATIVNAAGANQRVLTLNNAPGSRLEGITLTRGNDAGLGGGVYLNNCADVVFASCGINNNSNSYTSGMGIYAGDSLLTIDDCRIENNNVAPSAWQPKTGGGISVLRGTLLMRESIVASNKIAATHGPARGGGLYAQDALVTLRNCLVHDNSAQNDGDGVYVHSGTVGLENCTVVNNAGHGLFQAGGTAYATNCILWNNGVDATGTVTVAFSNVGIVAPSVTTNDCISTDPFFIGADVGNYRLRVRGGTLSLSVNAGNPVAEDWMLTGVDLDGNDRILNKRVDQGAYENLIPNKGTFISFK